jgi:hypothetical protein
MGDSTLALGRSHKLYASQSHDIFWMITIINSNEKVRSNSNQTTQMYNAISDRFGSLVLLIPKRLHLRTHYELSKRTIPHFAETLTHLTKSVTRRKPSKRRQKQVRQHLKSKLFIKRFLEVFWSNLKVMDSKNLHNLRHCTTDSTAIKSFRNILQ